MKSIITEQKECYLCGSNYRIETHHCLHGRANRKLANKYKLVVPLCSNCHYDVHNKDISKDRLLEATAQRAFENKVGTRQEFMLIFGKNYL